MKSIRLSLLVYFLLLLTAALAGVSWFSYQTTAGALRHQKLESDKLIQQQCDAQIEAAKTALDRRLVRQARAMLNRSESAFVHAEGMWNHLGLFGALTLPATHAPYSVRIWAEQNSSNQAFWPTEIYRAQPLYMHIELEDDVVANVDHDPDHDHFQTFRRNGDPMQRSESMGAKSFALTDAQKNVEFVTDLFDETELRPGVRVRRVTLKSPVQKYDVFNIPSVASSKIMPGPSLFGFKAPTKNPPKGKGGGWPPQPRPAVIPATVPSVFIQYASDLAPLQKKIAEIQSERDKKLAELQEAMTHDLHELRDRMLWISAITLVAIWLGGFCVIQLGLAPLAKMSDAVSKVSTKNFDLPLTTSKLPYELRPIAARLKDVLEHLQKAFAREKQSAADISHELRTPLAALMTTLDVALRKHRSAEEYREILDECRASGQHMYQLVERIMTLARLDAGADQYRPDEVDVSDIATSCAGMIRPLAKAKGLELRVHVPEPIITQTDPDKLREVLVNLLHNAIEYNRPNGAIDLSVERTNGHVRFAVRDTGIGIAPQALEHIFERYFRGDPSRHADTPHAGLGLSIVKCYVELMGGKIDVRSSTDGTTFTVELPYVEPAPPPETAVKAKPTLSGTGS